MAYSALLRMGYSLDEGQWVQLPNGQSWEEHPPSPLMAVSPCRDADGEALRLEFAELFAPLVRRVGAAALAARPSSPPPPAGPPLARAEVMAPPEELLPLAQMPKGRSASA